MRRAGRPLRIGAGDSVSEVLPQGEDGWGLSSPFFCAWKRIAFYDSPRESLAIWRNDIRQNKFMNWIFEIEFLKLNFKFDFKKWFFKSKIEFENKNQNLKQNVKLKLEIEKWILEINSCFDFKNWFWKMNLWNRIKNINWYIELLFWFIFIDLK